MTMVTQFRFWLAGLVLISLFLWLFKAILLPFVAGFAVAYMLDPWADKLESWGLSRRLATSSVMMLTLLTGFVFLLLLLPLIQDQAARLLTALPGYADRLQVWLTGLLEGPLGDYLGDGAPDAAAFGKDALAWIGGLLGGILKSGAALVNTLLLVLIAPIVAFYLLLDWDRMVDKLDSWLPLDHAPTLRRLAAEIDDVLAGFVRGQGSLCLFLAVFYGGLLSFAGLEYGIIVGLIAGGLSFIPYVGSLVGLVLSIGLAIAQFWPDYFQIGIIAAIFFAGQLIEGNVLQPLLVGGHVKLHPVWMMFALLAFTSLLGFVGALIAVPVAAAIGVLARFGIQYYLDSPYYLGITDRPADEQKDPLKDAE